MSHEVWDGEAQAFTAHIWDRFILVQLFFKLFNSSSFPGFWFLSSLLPFSLGNLCHGWLIPLTSLSCHRGFPGGTSSKRTCFPMQETYEDSIPGSRRSPGGGHGNRLQYSCLENPMDRGLAGYIHSGCKESDTTEATYHACTSRGVLTQGFWQRQKRPSSLGRTPSFFIRPATAFCANSLGLPNSVSLRPPS